MTGGGDRGAAIRARAEAIAADLFTNGAGERAERLVLEGGDLRNLGGCGYLPFVDRIADRLGRDLLAEIEAPSALDSQFRDDILALGAFAGQPHIAGYLDEPLRQRAYAAYRRLRDRYLGAVPAAALPEGRQDEKDAQR